MGSQFIFVVETNKKCQSDWMYMKDSIEHFYTFDRTHVKLSTVYMDGRGNYKKKKSQKHTEAATFKAKKLIINVNADKLLKKNYCVSASNFMNIMDQFEEFTRK